MKQTTIRVVLLFLFPSIIVASDFASELEKQLAEVMYGSTNQGGGPISFVQDRGGIAYLPNHEEPYSGDFLSIYPFAHGQYEEEGSYLNGMKHGLWVGYYRNGQKKYHATYDGGALQGEKVDWYENGQKKSQAIYLKGEVHGDLHRWSSDGVKMIPVPFKEGAESSSSTSIGSSIRNALQSELVKYFNYPRLAKRRGWEGKTVVNLVVNPNGELANLRIKESSGYGILDRNTIDSITRVNRLDLTGMPQIDQPYAIEFPVIGIEGSVLTFHQ